MTAEIIPLTDRTARLPLNRNPKRDKARRRVLQGISMLEALGDFEGIDMAVEAIQKAQERHES